MKPNAARSTTARPWYLDALAALAFTVQALVLGRLLRGIPFAALFAFLGSIGLAWLFGRMAWRNLTARRA